MADKTIPAPLSGEEVRTAILDKISAALERDCFLHPSASYDFFDGRLIMELRLHDAGREDVVKAAVSATSGEVPEEVPESHKIEMKLEPQPPNQVRVETGQGVPTSSGKKITYSRKVAEKANG
jgi:hypothetical protein